MKKKYVPGRSLEFTASSPTLVEQFASYETKAKNKLQSIGYYYKSKYKYIVEKRGIDIATEQVSLISNKDTEQAYTTIRDQNVDSVDQKELIGYLCKRYWQNTRRAQRSGKKTIRYCSIVLTFAIFVRSKMGNTSYDFLSAAYNLPSNSTLNQYDTLDSSAEDGLMHQILADMWYDFNNTHVVTSYSR